MKNTVTQRKYCTICNKKILATHQVVISGVTVFLCDYHYNDYLEQEDILENLNLGEEDYGNIATEY